MARIRRLIPSPAMAVALVALFMAMGGSAYALVVTSGSIKNNTIRSVDVRNGGLLGKDVRGDGLGGRAIKESSLGMVTRRSFVAHGSAHFAVVNDQRASRSEARGTTSAARTSEGRYQVFFDRDVRACAYYATIGDPNGCRPAAERADQRELARLQCQRRGDQDGERAATPAPRPTKPLPPTRPLLILR